MEDVNMESDLSFAISCRVMGCKSSVQIGEATISLNQHSQNVDKIITSNITADGNQFGYNFDDNTVGQITVELSNVTKKTPVKKLQETLVKNLKNFEESEKVMTSHLTASHTSQIVQTKNTSLESIQQPGQFREPPRVEQPRQEPQPKQTRARHVIANQSSNQVTRENPKSVSTNDIAGIYAADQSKVSNLTS